MNPTIVETEYEDGQPWVMRHPSVVVTLLGALLLFAQWAGTRWIQDHEAPQWKRVHGSIDRIAKYQMEQDRYLTQVLEAIAKGAGIDLPQRPPQLERSAIRVQDDREAHR